MKVEAAPLCVRNPKQCLERIIKKIAFWESCKASNVLEEEYQDKLNKMWDEKRTLLAQLKK
jgi:hypothetical protein